MLLLITKLTIKSYLQLISLKKLFSQSTIYNSFRFKTIPLNIYIYSNKKKNIQLKNGSFQLLIIIIIIILILIIILIIIILII